MESGELGGAGSDLASFAMSDVSFGVGWQKKRVMSSSQATETS